jgi:hypothetical protein
MLASIIPTAFALRRVLAFNSASASIASIAERSVLFFLDMIKCPM